MALPPLELFSLEGKGRLLPGGLFVVKRAIKQRGDFQRHQYSVGQVLFLDPRENPGPEGFRLISVVVCVMLV
jgi:hypothetical protein